MLTRRAVVQTGLAALAAPRIARDQMPHESITLMAYGGIFRDNYIRAVVEPFRQAFPSVTVSYAQGGNSAQMVGSLRAQKADPAGRRHNYGRHHRDDR
jgi:putative spermidine/putrescine transport system substrate-binding protein